VAEGLEVAPHTVKSADDTMHRSPLPDRRGVNTGAGRQPF
jgi:hypothetical protein